PKLLGQVVVLCIVRVACRQPDTAEPGEGIGRARSRGPGRATGSRSADPAPLRLECALRRIPAPAGFGFAFLARLALRPLPAAWAAAKAARHTRQAGHPRQATAAAHLAPHLLGLGTALHQAVDL